MYFDNLNSLITMDGHGVYVWLAYALALMICVYNLLNPILTRKQVIRSIKQSLRKETRKVN